jgi:hypothetical protein
LDAATLAIVLQEAGSTALTGLEFILQNRGLEPMSPEERDQAEQKMRTMSQERARSATQTIQDALDRADARDIEQGQESDLSGGDPEIIDQPEQPPVRTVAGSSAGPQEDPSGTSKAS